MKKQERITPTAWFWVFAVLGLLWNFMGVTAYLMEAYMKEKTIATYTSVQKAVFVDQPAWVTAAFAIAVFGGALGCIALLIRKKWATWLFLISLVSAVARTFYYFFLTNATEVFSMVQGTILPIAVIIIGALLFIFSKIASERRWII